MVVLASAFLSAAPLPVGAQQQPPAPGAGGGGGGGTTQVEPAQLLNPLDNIDTIDELLIAILNIFIVIMIPIIVFFIILAGFDYVTARGNPGKIQQATQALTYAIIGAVLILGAVSIAEIIKNTVEQF